METLAWIVFWMGLCSGAWYMFTRGGKKALSQYLSEKEEPADEWAEWKRLAAETRKRKLQEMDDWQAQFQALLKATCKRHEYDGKRWHGWYACINCGHEKDWTYYPGCACRYETFRDLVSKHGQFALTARNPVCTIHGRDQARQAAVEKARVMSKGGYDLHSTHYEH